MERIEFPMPLDDEEARIAVQRLLRGAAATGDAFRQEIGRIVTEILGDGDRDLIARRVAWLVWAGTAFAALCTELSDADFEDALVALERHFESILAVG